MSNSGSRISNYISDLIREDADNQSSTPVEEDFRRRAFIANRRDTPEAQAKEREAAEDRAANSTASFHSSPALSAVSLPESEPDMAPLAAPPDYATAIAARPHGNPQAEPSFHPRAMSPSTQHQSQNQHTPAYAADGQRQSMSDARPNIDETTSLLTHQKKPTSRGPRFSRWCSTPLSACRTFLVLALLVVIIVFATIPIGSSGDNNNGGGGGPGNPHNGRPVKSPWSPAQPIPWFPHSKQCEYSIYSDVKTFNFASLNDFSFLELMESTERLPQTIRGKVVVKPADDIDQKSDVKLQIRYATTSPWQVVSSNYEVTHDSFTLQLPDLDRTGQSSSAQPCLGVYASIEIRQGLKLNDWGLTTGHLDVEVAEGLFARDDGQQQHIYLQVAGKSIFNTVSGDCKVAHWSSRRTIIESISGTISGAFDLLDLLFIKTNSGTIATTVEPKEEDPDYPAPAELSVASNSGTISVRLPLNGTVPKRDYQTRLESSSSTIRADLIHGSSTNIHTNSGGIHVDLLPYILDTKNVPSLHTTTNSGTTIINVLPPHIVPGESWAEVHTDHKSTSTSGTVHIVYPDEWQGLAAAESTSGIISITGKDVKVIDSGSLAGVFRHVLARKGVGKGRVGIKTNSGTIDLRLGEK